MGKRLIQFAGVPVLAALVLTLGPARVGAAPSRVARDLRLVHTVSRYPVAAAGRGWGANTRVWVTLTTSGWTVGREIATKADGRFRVGIKDGRPCSAFVLRTRDLRGHVKSLSVPARHCPATYTVVPISIVLLHGKAILPDPPVVLGPNGPQQVTVPLGGRISFIQSGSPGPFTPHEDPAYLALVQTLPTPSSCSTDCVRARTSSWTYLAIKPGSTVLDLSPACRSVTPPCGRPDLGVRIEITP